MKFILNWCFILLFVTICSVYGKTESNGTTSAFKPYTTKDLIIDLYKSFTSDGSSTNSSSTATSLKPFQRDVKASTSSVSLLSYGNLALLGAVVLGGLAYVAPTLMPDYRRRAGPMPPMHPVYPHRFFDSLSDFSADMIPYIENEIQQQGHNFYKRNKRAAATEERLNLQDFLSKRFMAVSESVMVWAERTLDNLPNLPRLEAQACMKRCICEAHNQPKKYGLTGLVLQLFFPPYIESDTPSKIISKYQLAARYGRTENANCAVQYDDCIVNFLDLVQSVTNLIL